MSGGWGQSLPTFCGPSGAVTPNTLFDDHITCHPPKCADNLLVQYIPVLCLRSFPPSPPNPNPIFPTVTDPSLIPEEFDCVPIATWTSKSFAMSLELSDHKCTKHPPEITLYYLICNPKCPCQISSSGVWIKTKSYIQSVRSICQFPRHYDDDKYQYVMWCPLGVVNRNIVGVSLPTLKEVCVDS